MIGKIFLYHRGSKKNISIISDQFRIFNILFWFYIKGIVGFGKMFPSQDIKGIEIADKGWVTTPKRFLSQRSSTWFMSYHFQPLLAATKITHNFDLLPRSMRRTVSMVWILVRLMSLVITLAVWHCVDYNCKIKVLWLRRLSHNQSSVVLCVYL